MALPFGYELSRELAQLTLYMSYFVPAYNDPETGEQFTATSWTITYLDLEAGTSSSGGGFAGGESETIIDSYSLGLSFRYNITLFAMNTFSGESSTQTFNIMSADGDLGPAVLAGNGLSDLLIGGAFDDVVRGFGGDDALDGGGGADILDGGAGDDWLDGGLGDDVMAGGSGNDVYIVDSSEDIIAETTTGGIDQMRASVTATIAANVEHLILTGALAIDGIGASSNDIIEGNAAANHIYGLDGNDTLRGGEGNDSVYGGTGNDSLEGGTGVDSLYGGVGNDTYLIAATDDRVIELLGEGTDTVLIQGLATYVMTAEVEQLALADGATASLRATGNALANTMTGGNGNDSFDGGIGNDTLRGGGGNDTLTGGAGADSLDGGAGTNTASYALSDAAVVVNLVALTASGGHATGDALNTTIQNLVGSAHGDTLLGSALANVLSGGIGNDTIDGHSGNDTITGGIGADSLSGGDGVDLLSYVGSVAAVTVDLTANTASGGDATGDIIAGFESATGGNGDDSISGTGSANALVGGLGNDTLRGGLGADTLTGGVGADSLDGGDGLDIISYLGTSGALSIDLLSQIVSGGDAQGDLIAGIDGAYGSNAADTLLGSTVANILSGYGGDDVIDGRGGHDVISGGAGADTLTGGTGTDTLSYATSTTRVVVDLELNSTFGGDSHGDVIAEFEYLVGGSADDALYGDNGNNAISGGGGSDFMAGKLGNDTLTGGAGADIFVYALGSGTDLITDFSVTSGDILYLNMGTSFDTFAEYMSVATSTGVGNADTTFTFAPDTIIVVRGVARSLFSANDFEF